MTMTHGRGWDKADVFANEAKPTRFPMGFPPLANKALEIYEQYYKCRHFSRWSTSDLMQLYSLSMLQVRLQKEMSEFETQPLLVMSAKGEEKQNPYHTAFYKLQSQHLQLLQKLALTTAPSSMANQTKTWVAEVGAHDQLWGGKPANPLLARADTDD